MAGFDYDLGGVKYRSERELSEQEVQKLYQDYEQAGLLNPEVQQQQQMMWKDVSQNKAILDAAKTYFEESSGKPWEGTPEELTDEYYEQMRYFEGNTASMGTLVARLNGVGEMSERERQALAVMFGAWDNIVPFYEDENRKWDAFLDHAEVNLLDPANLSGLISFGTGTAAGIASKQVAKAGVRRLLLEGFKKGAISGTTNAAAVGTALSAGNQETRTELGMQDEIDWGTVGTTGVISGTLGGVIGGTIGMGGAGVKALRADGTPATPNAPAIETQPVIRPDMDSMQVTAAATEKWRQVLADPSITGEARQAARNEFIRNIGDTTRQRLDRMPNGVGQKITNEQAYDNGVNLLTELGIKFDDDLTPESLVNQLYSKYTQGKVALKDSTSFKALTIKLENEMYDKFLRESAAKDGDPWSSFASFEKVIALSEDLSSQSGRDLQLQSLRQRIGTSKYASVLQRFRKMNEDGKALTAQEAIAEIKLVEEKGAGWGHKTVDALNEFWINNILGSPVTLGINTVSSMAHLIERNITDIGAGVLAGDARQLRRAVTQAGRELTAAPSAFYYALKSFNNSKNYIDPGRAFSGDGDEVRSIGTRDYKISNLVNPMRMGAELKAKDESLADATMNLLGNFNRLVGGRGMLATDELVKQLAFRGKLRADVTDLALQRVGVDGGFKNVAEAHKWAKGEFNRLMDEHIDAVGRNAQPEDPLLVAALNEAREVTFQGDYRTDPFGKVGKAVAGVSAKHPVMKQIVPFVRTPTNLVSWAAERTPGLQLLSKEFRTMLNDPNPQVRARAEMVMHLGTLYWTAAMSTAMSGNLQGPGNIQDYNNQKINEAAGDLPYSIMDEDGNRVQIRRGDPMARFMMTIGAVQDAMAHNQEDGTAMFVAGALGTAKALLEVPSLTGIADIFALGTDTLGGRDPMGALGTFTENRIKTMVPYYRFYRDVLVPEGVDRNLFVNVGLNPEDIWNTAVFADNPEDPYDKKRDFLGRPIEVRDNYGFELSGFAMEPKSDDPIAIEMKRLNSSRNAPAKIRKGVDLTEIRVKPDGRQSVYDLWRELSGTVRMEGMRGKAIGENTRAKSGATLEEALNYEMNSKPYKEIFGDAKRLERLNSIIAQYESYVFDQVLPKTLPADHELWKRTSFNKVQAMRGEAQVMDKFIDNNEQRLRELNSPLIGN